MQQTLLKHFLIIFSHPLILKSENYRITALPHYHIIAFSNSRIFKFSNSHIPNNKLIRPH